MTILSTLANCTVPSRGAQDQASVLQSWNAELTNDATPDKRSDRQVGSVVRTDTLLAAGGADSGCAGSTAPQALGGGDRCTPEAATRACSRA